MKILSDFIIKPIISEKSFAEAKAYNKYTFLVSKDANKTDIKNAIEKLFGVKVEKVYTNNVKEKKLRQTRLGRQNLDLSYKKARVKLPQDQKIDIFEEDTKKEKGGKKDK